jgi:ATP phosphoribosyltransferase
MLKIALSKGRIFDETLPLLEKIGIVPLEHPETSRKLILDTNQEDIKLVIIRATDVPTYVEYGATDVGIAGKDVLLEYGGDDLYEPVDLKIAQCRLMEAVPVIPRPSRNRLRIATKYVKCTQNYYAQQGIQVDIIKLYGSMELAPLSDIDLADRIVDLVDTGKTLEANGLKPLEPPIAYISARLIVNKAAMKIKHTQIKSLITRLKMAVHDNQ